MKVIRATGTGVAIVKIILQPIVMLFDPNFQRKINRRKFDTVLVKNLFDEINGSSSIT